MDHSSNLKSDVLRRLSEHLDTLSEQVFDLEQQLGYVLDPSKARNPLPLTKFQSLDFVRQSLEDCSLLLHFLSRLDSEESETETNFTEIAQKLKMNTTQAVVLPRFQNEVLSGSGETGDVDLF